MRKRTLQEFILKSHQVHNNKYLYTSYIDSWTKVEIICLIHGSWFQEPANHLAGHGCPKCKTEKIKSLRRNTTEQFVKKACEIHGSTYDYSCVQYINVNTKVKIICVTHGPFFQIPYNHTKGSGCPVCGRTTSKGERLIANILKKNDILFEVEKRFPGLKGKRKHLQYDFWVPEIQLLIEYDGIQHFREQNFTRNIEKSIRTHIQIKKSEENKKIYAYKNGYNLLRIPYTTSTREEILTLLNTYFPRALV